MMKMQNRFLYLILEKARCWSILFEGKYLYDINTQRGSMTTYRDKTGNLFGITNEYLYTKDKRGKELFVYNTKGKEIV